MNKQSETDVLYAVTAAVTARAFLGGQLRAVSQLGRVGLVVGDEIPQDLVKSEGIRGFTLGLSRDPSPTADALALGRLVKLIRRQRPRTVVFGTPKMGLLAALATFACRTPRRVYVIHGYRWEGSHGWRRFALAGLEALACLIATDVIAVSPSVGETAVRKLGVAAEKVRVLNHGSANGIDSRRFVPIKNEERQAIRHQLGLPTEALIFVFAGRLTRDKGVQQLGQVWQSIVSTSRGVHLVVVGQPEPAEQADAVAINQLSSMTSVSVWPATDAMEKLLGCADINLSLSRREGMPTVILEAASCEVPTVAYRVTGTVDAVNADTGILVALDDVRAYVAAVLALSTDHDVRISMGEAARRRVQAEFEPTDVWSAWVDFLSSRPVGR